MQPFLARYFGIRPLTRRQWVSGGIIFALYFGIMLIANIQVRNPILFFPASGIALSLLFMDGVELWPFVYAASLFGNIAGGYPIPFIVLMPVAQTFMAALGASLMRHGNLDPIFRRSRDIFLMLGIVAVVALIVPTFASFANQLTFLSTGHYFPLTPWGYRYTSTLFSLVIMVPFLLRWLAKPKFNRNWVEVVEITGIFALLILISVAIAFFQITEVAGVQLVYLLFVPLFWTALRLRPRFVSLALVIVSAIALSGLLLGPDPVGSAFFSVRLFQYEAFLITIAVMFYIIVSLEENRRLTSNLLKNQLATLENALSRISSESQAKNDFIAVLAHELRNPLAPIMSGIDILKLKTDLPDDEKEMVDVMEDRMNTVKRLLDDLLDISRISEGKLTLTSERVDLETIVRRAIISTTHLIRERHQLFTFKEPKEDIIVMGDPVRLEQIVSNLLTNASRYSDSGEQITLTLTKEGGNAKITVKDTGIGIAPESIEHIFLPFHQVEQGARTKKGLGIGLALVRNFVELHGGSVSVQSRGVGHGSTFTILLPLATS